MAEFFGIAPGQERVVPGFRVRVTDDGQKVYMAGKWLDLGDDHAVAWIEKRYMFVRPDGKRLFLGEFPAWVCKAKTGQIAMMFNISQFRSGTIEIE